MKTELPEKASLKKKGWSYRSAAPVLEVTYQHLSEVMNRKRSSVRLLRKIRALPFRDAKKTKTEKEVAS